VRARESPSHAVPKPSLRTCLRGIRPLWLRLLATGCDVRSVCQACDLDPALVIDTNARVDYPVLLRLWQRAEEVTRDPLVGIRAAELVDFHVVNIAQLNEYIGIQLFAASATLGDGLERYARAFAVNNGPCRLEWTSDESGGRLRLHTPSQPPAATAYNEYLLATASRAAVGFATRSPATLRIELARRDGARAEYERVFGAPVRFGAPHDALFAAAADLKVALRTARPVGFVRALEQKLHEAVDSGDDCDVSNRVRDLLAAKLESGLVSIAEVAQTLDLSTRTLMRRLADNGTGYQQLLDEVRSQRARQYLIDTDLSIGDISALLAFTEVSAFNRAFRRWCGHAPSTFRERSRSHRRRAKRIKKHDGAA
jgi:AraC-like DNA-binding protein